MLSSLQLDLHFPKRISEFLFQITNKQHLNSTQKQRPASVELREMLERSESCIRLFYNRFWGIYIFKLYYLHNIDWNPHICHGCSFRWNKILEFATFQL